MFYYCLGVWGRKNKKIFEKLSLMPKYVFSQALSNLDFYAECYKASQVETKRVGCWLPPPENFFKLNTDGALFFDKQEARIGAMS